ncbi:prenyltransferase [Lipingzhangella sp. LS1_29]|uniref:Prenyltransferase n=1 Tax=Lipingzhangella rawalii TaxID=2055835 RepID=A0ABU2H209_9ACTN|nr:prenyltransferase [Lipingzhangella rawalii]MDS1269337.1 prenyltransferase [Lipingzhangella rawalii]
MTMASSETLYGAHHFMQREARLLDRHRFAYHLESGPVAPVRAALEPYRNVDGGYGNALDPDLRGHGSQPKCTELALRIQDELGEIPRDSASHIATYLVSISRPDGGVPWVLPTVRHTESAPHWRNAENFGGSLNPTAALAGILHKHHVTHPWRDHATAFCWERIARMEWTTPDEAQSVCTFLQYVPDQTRAHREFDRIGVMIRAVFELDPSAVGHVRTPLDLATHPGHVARRLFSDEEIHTHLDALVSAQQSDGGWPAHRDSWSHVAQAEWRGIRTLDYLLTLRNYGRLDG